MNDHRQVQPKLASDHPEAQVALVALGQRLRVARVSRDITLADMAKRMGVTPNTLGRLERGAPGVSMETLALALWHMGLIEHLSGVAAADADAEGQRLATLRAPARARGRNSLNSSGWSNLDKL